MSWRGLFLVLVIVVAAVSTVVGRLPIAASVVATAAAGSSARSARQNRSVALFWAALSIWTFSMAVNTLAIQLRTPNGSWFDRIPDVSLATCALSVTVATWVGARPLLTHRATRARALIALPAGLLLLLGVLVGDAAFSVDIDRALRITGLVMIALSLPVFVGFAWLIGQELHRRGRRAETILLAGSIGHAFAHVSALNSQRPEGIWVAIIFSSGGVLLAALHPTSLLVGSALDTGGHTIRPRLWPAGLAGTAAVALWVAAKLLDGRVDTPTIALVVALAVGTAMFAGRELAGPRKPLVLPFSKKDRALHGVPRQLITGSVRLIGRPVHRVVDGSIVGIEAEPSWATGKRPHIPLADAATAVELNPWLQDATLTAAKAHLPAITATLGGDDPFLSIPFDPEATASADQGDSVEGLVLRTPADRAVEGSVVSWQDRGAMVHSVAPSERRGVLVDIVTVGLDEPLPKTSMTLARSNLLKAKHSGVMFVVDDEQAPVQIGTILSPIVAEDSEVISVNEAEG